MTKDQTATQEALKLAKEHIKQKSLFPPKKPAFIKKETRNEIGNNTGSTLQIEKSEHGRITESDHSLDGVLKFHSRYSCCFHHTAGGYP